MRKAIITQFEKRAFPDAKKHPSFRPGDRIRVHYKVEEAAKSDEDDKARFRIQVFEGVCLRFRKGGIDSTFTIRRIGANGIGVERVFALNSPLIDRVEMISGGTVRRSRLYYLRILSGKAARIRARRLKLGEFATATEEYNNAESEVGAANAESIAAK